ncbi:MAG: aminopeptidase [Planctomycetota bacterium]
MPCARDRQEQRVFVKLISLALAASPLLAGCGELPYLAQLVEGELASQGRSEPIDDVLASGRLSEEEAAKLQLIVDAREFAGNAMGLYVGKSYRTFYDTSGAPLAWNLSAARQDALVPKTWAFPIVGVVPYLAFFDEGMLRQRERQLAEAGYDTLTYELDAYSTLGVLENPVRSPMLKRGKLSLVETIIHELLHNTVWRMNETVFNESLATFVGRQGAIDFLRLHYGETAGWTELARAYYADTDAVNAFVLQLYADLAAYYAEPGEPEEKIAGRASVFAAARARFAASILPDLNYPDVWSDYAELPANNAWVLINYRYNLDLSLFADVYAAHAGDWPATIAVYQAAADAPGDPFEYLREWLAARR